MLIIRDKSTIPENAKQGVVALGNFDGLHLGHQSLINKAKEVATATGKPLGLLSFEPHPRSVFRPELPRLRIMRFREKAEMLAKQNMDFLRIIRFTQDFASMPAEAFVANILCEQLEVSHIVTGDDFTFGHNREGNAAFMQEMSARYGFGYDALPELKLNGTRCSSTHIRHLLEKGAMEEVACFLGREYSISGCVQQGEKRGRELGFPTANLTLSGLYTPAKGVYAVKVMYEGKVRKGVANLGTKPTFSGQKLGLEVHIFDFNDDIYGKFMTVSLLHFIRPEQKFTSFEALKMQIIKDSAEAREKF